MTECAVKWIQLVTLRIEGRATRPGSLREYVFKTVQAICLKSYVIQSSFEKKVYVGDFIAPGGYSMGWNLGCNNIHNKDWLYFPSYQPGKFSCNVFCGRNSNALNGAIFNIFLAAGWLPPISRAPYGRFLPARPGPYSCCPPSEKHHLLACIRPNKIKRQVWSGPPGCFSNARLISYVPRH